MRIGSKPKGSSSRLRAHQIGVSQDLARRAVGDDATLVHHEGSRAQLERVGQVVGDHQRRDAETPHDVGELTARHRIEVRRGLVEHEDVWPHREHGRGRDSATLTEAQVVGRPVGVGLHPHGG